MNSSLSIIDLTNHVVHLRTVKNRINCAALLIAAQLSDAPGDIASKVMTPVVVTTE